MRGFLTLTYIYIIVASLCSCTLKDFEPSEWSVSPELSLSESGIVAGSVANTYTVNVTTNYQHFSAVSNQAWCSVTADNQNNKVLIKVDNNDGVVQRTAIVTVKIVRGGTSLTKDVAIYQIGGKWDLIEGTDIRLRWAYEISESQRNIISEQIRQLVFVEGGTFLMGSQSDDTEAPNYYRWADNYNKVHQVSLSDYYIGKFEVTQEQWAAVMSSSPSRYEGGKKPVENISWEEAMEYVTKLSELTGLTILLPTSAQWEYAARGGKYSMGYLYAGSDDLASVAHYVEYDVSEASPGYSTSEVGQKQPNELGLYDMTGNVAELCSDWYGDVSSDEQTDPVGPNSGTTHIERGGDFTGFVTQRGVVYRVSAFYFTTEKQANKTSFTGLRIVFKR